MLTFSAGLPGARVRRLLEEPTEGRISIAGWVKFLDGDAPVSACYGEACRGMNGGSAPRVADCRTWSG